jgi:hypothetical protein
VLSLASVLQTEQHLWPEYYNMGHSKVFPLAVGHIPHLANQCSHLQVTLKSLATLYLETRPKPSLPFCNERPYAQLGFTNEAPVDAFRPDFAVGEKDVLDLIESPPRSCASL